MSSLYQNNDERERLERLINRRRLKPPIRKLLQKAKGSLGPGERLKAGKQLSYSELIDQLDKAITNGWLAVNDFAEVLSDSEIAGNQHVLFFELPGKNVGERRQFFDSISGPTGTAITSSSVRDFLTVPQSSFYQVASQSSDEVIIKIVAQREYWITKELPTKDPDRRLQELIRHRERVPLIVKADLSKKLVQLRVPPRETGSPGSAKTHFQYASQVLSNHYKLGESDGWFKKMKPIPLGNAFKTLVNDISSLVSMWSDSPENRKIATSIKNKGRPNSDRDLRNDDDWNHAKGYARKAISGYFACGSDLVLFARLCDDRIQIEKGTFRQVARLFVTRHCGDGDLENVIANVRSHV